MIKYILSPIPLSQNNVFISTLNNVDKHGGWSYIFTNSFFGYNGMYYIDTQMDPKLVRWAIDIHYLANLQKKELINISEFILMLA